MSDSHRTILLSQLRISVGPFLCDCKKKRFDLIDANHKPECRWIQCLKELRNLSQEVNNDLAWCDCGDSMDCQPIFNKNSMVVDYEYYCLGCDQKYRLVKVGNRKFCKSLVIPKDVCYLYFKEGVQTDVCSEPGYTVRGEQMIMDLTPEKDIIGIELLSSKECEKPCMGGGKDASKEKDNQD